jgi:hypothetical protein
MFVFSARSPYTFAKSLPTLPILLHSWLRKVAILVSVILENVSRGLNGLSGVLPISLKDWGLVESQLQDLDDLWL